MFARGVHLGSIIDFPKGVAWRAKEMLELVHTNICGPMRTHSHAQNKYFILFIDDYTRMTWVYFMRERSEVPTLLFHHALESLENSEHFRSFPYEIHPCLKQVLYSFY